MVRMALMAPKRAHEERNALRGLFTWYAPILSLNAVPRSLVLDCASNRATVQSALCQTERR